MECNLYFSQKNINFTHISHKYLSKKYKKNMKRWAMGAD
nr:MAG TPA: hypothetical protein [Caudoviricetes sp.]